MRFPILDLAKGGYCLRHILWNQGLLVCASDPQRELDESVVDKLVSTFYVSEVLVSLQVSTVCRLSIGSYFPRPIDLIPTNTHHNASST